jgi:hypothetical protein
MGISFAHGSQKDGYWRPCGDYGCLNLIATPDKCPMSNMMQDLANGLHGCTILTKIDLKKGDYQMSVVVEDFLKTAIITPFGLFEYFFTRFGLFHTT